VAHDAAKTVGREQAREELGCDQVLFAPGGQVQETGAANFLLFDAER